LKLTSRNRGNNRKYNSVWWSNWVPWY